MKTSFIATSTLSQSLRYQMMRMQTELVQRQQEATTGRVADPGVALGSRAGFTFSMARDIERLDGLIKANGLTGSRLSATLDTLDQLSKVGQDLLSTVITATSGTSDKEVTRDVAKSALQTMTSLLNSNMDGQYLFAGINTDVKPLNDFTDPASPNRTQFEADFATHFGFAPTDAGAADITAAEMQDFLDTVVEPGFMGADWQTNWSNASDEKITSRITLSETAETSATANGEAMRKLAMATSVLTSLLDGPLNEETQRYLYDRTTELVGQALNDIASTQSQLGITQKRVSDASERLSAQVDLSKSLITDLEGVDPFEAATKVNELLTQIETSYALTARIQKLSLLRYL